MSQSIIASDPFWERELFGPLVPVGLYRWYQEHAPVHWSAGLRAWLIFRQSDVTEVLLNSKKFSANPSNSTENFLNQPIGGLPNILFTTAGLKTINNTDPPEHGKLRQLLTNRLSSASIQKLSEVLEPHIESIIRSLKDGDAVEIVEDVARPVAMQGILCLLGLDRDSQAFLCQHLKQLRNATRWSSSQQNHKEAANSAIELRHFLEPIIKHRREEPGDDIISVLTQAMGNSEGMESIDAIATIILLLVAGQETTTSAISATIWRLARMPDQWSALVANPAAVHKVIDEVLRLDSPIHSVVRFCTEETQLNDQHIKQGQTVLAMVAAANRDARVFSQSDEFSLERDSSGHLAFGFGVHRCIGFHLGKMEVALVIKELLRQFPERLPRFVDCRWSATLMFRGLERLWVEPKAKISESVVEYYTAVRQYISPSLIPQEDYQRILFAAESIPEAFARLCFGLECPLLGEPKVDIGFQLEPDGTWVSAISEILDDIGGSEDNALEAWQKLQRFGTTWHGGLIDMAWLEFDASGERPRTPSIFWRVRAGSNREEQRMALTSVLDPVAADNAERIIASMPPAWNLAKIGSFLSRESKLIRLCLQNPNSINESAQFLSSKGWNSAYLEKLLKLVAIFLRVDLTVDLLPDLEGWIGLECSFPGGNVKNEFGWKAGLHRLVENGLADGSRVNEVFDFCGRATILSNSQDWPPSIRQRWLANPIQRVPIMSRSISHIKVALAPNGHIKTKAYITAKIDWVEVL